MLVLWDILKKTIVCFLRPNRVQHKQKTVAGELLGTGTLTLKDQAISC